MGNTSPRLKHLHSKFSPRKKLYKKKGSIPALKPQTCCYLQTQRDKRSDTWLYRDLILPAKPGGAMFLCSVGSNLIISGQQGAFASVEQFMISWFQISLQASKIPQACCWWRGDFTSSDQQVLAWIQPDRQSLILYTNNSKAPACGTADGRAGVGPASSYSPGNSSLSCRRSDLVITLTDASWTQ